MKVIAQIALILSINCLTGCASNPPVTIAMTELGTATKTDLGTHGLRLARVVNVTGLNSEEVVGTYSIDPDPPLIDTPPLIGSSNIPDTLAPRLTPGCSLISETTFDSGAVTADDVLNVRDALTAVDEATIDLTRLKINQEILDSIKQSYAENPDSKLLDKAKTIDSNVVDKDTLDAAVNGAHEAVKTAINTLNMNRNKLTKLMTKPGVIITTWSRGSKFNASANSSDAATASYQRSSEKFGYLILGQPRISSLAVGHDFLDRVRGDEYGLTDRVDPTRLYVTQYELSAKYLAWTESQSGTITARVNAQIDKVVSALGNVPNLKDKLEALKLEIGAGYTSNYLASNTGSIPKGTLKAYNVNFSTDESYQASVKAEMFRSKEYHPVYTARSTLRGLMKDLNGGYWYTLTKPAPAGGLATKPCSTDFYTDILSERGSVSASNNAEVIH